MLGFSGTIEIERNIMGEYENIYQIIDEFKESYDLFLIDLTINDKKVEYSFRSKYTHENEIYYDMGDMIISLYLIGDERIIKFKMRTTDEDKFLIIYKSLKKIVKKHYKPYVE